MTALPQYISNLLREIAASEGFSDARITPQIGSNTGDGFIGDIVRVIISGTRETTNNISTQDELQLVCKLNPPDPLRRDGFQSTVLFEREALVYNKILPLFAKFQRSKGLSDSDSFQCYPKCYAAVANADKDEFAIIMEDLRPKGFVMWPKQIPAPADHLKRVVEELGKLHAISFALKDQQPDVYDDLREASDLLRITARGNGTANWIKLAFDNAISLLTDESHRQIAIEMRNNVYQVLDDHFSDGAGDPFGVITHGDTWILNQLFRYDNETRDLAEVSLLDWQFTRLSSPVYDLFDVLLATSDKEFRDKNYQNIIEHYYKSLNEAIKKLGSDPAKLFTFEDLQKQLKQFGKYGFYIGIVATVAILPDEYIPDLSAISQSAPKMDSNATESLSLYDEKVGVLLRGKINDLFTDMLALGYYTD